MNLKKLTKKGADGSSITYEFDVPKVPQMEGVPHPGEPKGTDTVPAWLTPGEFVVNAEATRMFEPQIEAMNEAGRAVQKAQGGSIPEYHEDGGVAGSSHLGGQGFVDDEREDELRANIYRHALQGDITVDTLDNLGNLRPEHKAMAMKGINDRYAANNPDVMVPAVDEVPSPMIPEEPQVPVYPEGLEEVMTGQVPAGNVVPNTQNVGDVPMELSGQDPRDMLSQQEAEREIPIITDEFGAGVLPGEGSRAETINKDRNIAEITGGVIGMDEDVKKVRAKQQADKAAELEEALANNASKKAQQLQETVDNTEDEDNPGKDGTPPGKLEEEGNKKKKEDPTMWDKAKSFIFDAFDEVLDTKGLTQAALLYLGSRALGYSHAGSLNYVGKAYASQIQNKLKTADDASTSNKYTKDSIEKYRKSGNASDLVAKPIAPKRKSVGDVFYTKDGNKPITLYKYEDSKGNIYLGDGQGNPIENTKVHQQKSRIKGTDEYTTRINNVKKSATNVLSKLNVGEDNKPKISGYVPEADASRVATWSVENNVSPERIEALYSNAYADMINSRNSGESNMSTLVPYLEQQIIRDKTSGNESLFISKGYADDKDGSKFVNPEKLELVNDTVENMLKSQGNPATVSDIVNQYYAIKMKEYEELGDGKSKYEDAANDDENGFFVFISEDLKLDNRLK